MLRNQKREGCQPMSMRHMPDIVLSPLHLLAHSLLTIVLQIRSCYFLLLINEAAEVLGV